MEQNSGKMVFWHRNKLLTQQNHPMTRLPSSTHRIAIVMTCAGLIWTGFQPIALSQTLRPRFTTRTVTVAQSTPLNTKIVPGISIGSITANTSYQDLVKIFGPEKLSDVRPPDAKETEREFGTRINLGPDWSLTVVWKDKTKTKPYETIDMGRGWKLPGDVQLGMSIAELQQKMGPFQVVGFGGPYGGIVPLTNTKLEQYFGKMIIQLAPKPGAEKKFPQQFKAVSGKDEPLIASNDPNWLPLDMTVKYIVMLFPKK
jgi:hypothetical protein